MKHTFAFIDKLIVIISFLPSKKIDNEKDKIKTRKIISLVKEYSQIIRTLLINHNNEIYLNQLHQEHIDEIEGWVEKVDGALIKIKILLDELDKDLERFERLLESNHIQPREYQRILGDISEGMIQTGLHDEKEELVKLRKMAVFEIDRLEEIIEKIHLDGMHKWLNISRLEQKERIIEHEKFFVKLFS